MSPSWTIEQWELAILAANTAGTVVLAVTMIYLRSIFVTHREHVELKARVERHGERLNMGDGRFNLADERMKSLPTAEAMHRLGLGMAQIEGKMGAVVAQLDGIAQRVTDMERPLEMIQEHLLREARR